MATGVEVISAISALSQVTGQFLNFSNELRKLVACIKNGREEVNQLLREVVLFSDLLQYFSNTMSDVENKKENFVINALEPKLINGIHEQSKEILIGIDTLLDNVQGFRLDSEIAFTTRLKCGWIWYIKREKVKPHLLSISAVKSSVSVFLSLFTINEKLNQIEILRPQDDAVEIARLKKEIKELRRDLKTRTKICKDTHRECRRLDHAPKLEYAKMVQRLVSKEQRKAGRVMKDLRSAESSNTPSKSQSSVAGRSSLGYSSEIEIQQNSSNLSHRSSDSSGPWWPTPLNVRNAGPSRLSREEPAQVRIPRGLGVPAVGPPVHQALPPNPRASQATLPEGPVIVDDGSGLREDSHIPRIARPRPVASNRG